MFVIKIESLNNKLIKLVSSLKMKKARDKEELFFAEGERNVSDGIKKASAEMIFISEGYKGNKDFPCKTYEVSDGVFKKISDTETPQGILGVFKKKEGSLSDIKGNAVILNGVRDPGNMGTIIRCAKAAGFDTIICDKTCTDIYSPKTVRAAMSGIFGLNAVVSENLFEDIRKLKDMGYEIIAADMDGESSFKAKLKFPLALILGNEANGIDEEILKASDRIISIPMNGEIESLNVAVAGSVLMFEAARQLTEK